MTSLKSQITRTILVKLVIGYLTLTCIFAAILWKWAYPVLDENILQKVPYQLLWLLIGLLIWLLIPLLVFTLYLIYLQYFKKPIVLKIPEDPFRPDDPDYGIK